MKKRSVFRLEHSVLRIGPWRAECYAEGHGGLTDDEIELIAFTRRVMDAAKIKLPTPSSDGIVDFNPDYVCAAKSLNSLRKWFDASKDYIDTLFDAGFTVREYVVRREDVLDGGNQVAVILDRVIKEIDHTLLALFKN